MLGRDFDWTQGPAGWSWSGPGPSKTGLPAPALRGDFQLDNAATSLMACACLQGRLPVTTGRLGLGLRQARLDGRFQVLSGPVTWILDVAHNEQAVRASTENLRSFRCSGRLHAVLGILKGRDPKAIAEPLAEQVHAWYLGQSTDPRSLPVSDLRTGMAGIETHADLNCCGTITEALRDAERAARPGDCILAFGSFTTVEAALRWRHSRPSS